jgi:hypothetical protein
VYASNEIFTFSAVVATERREEGTGKIPSRKFAAAASFSLPLRRNSKLSHYIFIYQHFLNTRERFAAMSFLRPPARSATPRTLSQ